MAAVVGEPVVRQVVMDMVGVEQRDEDIHIEERRSGHESIDQAISRLLTVPQLVDQLHRWSASIGWPAREDRYTVSGSSRARRLKRRAGELRDDAARRQAPDRRQFLDSLEDIVIDIERGTHYGSISHHTSDVNWSSCCRANDAAGRPIGLPASAGEAPPQTVPTRLAPPR